MARSGSPVPGHPVLSAGLVTRQSERLRARPESDWSLGSAPTAGRVEAMCGLTLPCRRCGPTAACVVVADRLQCFRCGDERQFTRAPLYLVTGAPATGKSNVVAHLADRLPGVAVFDTDLFGPLSHPDWEAWASSW